MKGLDEISFWRMAGSMNRPDLNAVLFAELVAEVTHGMHMILMGFALFAQAPEDVTAVSRRLRYSL